MKALELNQPFALGIICETKGSSPQKKGAKAIFFGDGTILGTLGGGCLEAEVQARARHSLITGKPELFDLLLDHDFGWDDGLICGGLVKVLILPNAERFKDVWTKLIKVEAPLSWVIDRDYNVSLSPQSGEYLYSETVMPQCNLWIAGSGHIARAVAPLALDLDFSVTIFDDRPSMANEIYFPAGVRFCVDDWDKILNIPFPSAPVFGVICTRGHRHDAVVLRQWINKPFAFLGMIGSRRKARLIFEEFINKNWATAEEIARVACPVGLPIHSQTAPEIAISIAAQLVQVRAEKIYNITK